MIDHLVPDMSVWKKCAFIINSCEDIEKSLIIFFLFSCNKIFKRISFG